MMRSFYMSIAILLAVVFSITGCTSGHKQPSDRVSSATSSDKASSAVSDVLDNPKNYSGAGQLVPFTPEEYIQFVLENGVNIIEAEYTGKCIPDEYNIHDEILSFKPTKIIYGEQLPEEIDVYRWRDRSAEGIGVSLEPKYLTGEPNMKKFIKGKIYTLVLYKQFHKVNGYVYADGTGEAPYYLDDIDIDGYVELLLQAASNESVSG